MHACTIVHYVDSIKYLKCSHWMIHWMFPPSRPSHTKTKPTKCVENANTELWIAPTSPNGMRKEYGEKSSFQFLVNIILPRVAKHWNVLPVFVFNSNSLSRLFLHIIFFFLPQLTTLSFSRRFFSALVSSELYACFVVKKKIQENM